jgi:hypothetical protein
MAKALGSSLAGHNIDLRVVTAWKSCRSNSGFLNWNTCRALLEEKMTVSSTIFVHHGSQHEAALFYKTVFRAKVLRKPSSG